MLYNDLLKSAEDLLSAMRGSHKQANLRRAMSSIYYALFHYLATNCADSFIGKKPSHEKEVWRHVYRSLAHSTAKQACDGTYIGKFPEIFQEYADLFKNMQLKRHEADYDPYAFFSKEDVELHIKEAKNVIENLRNAPLKDRKAFAALVLLGKPKSYLQSRPR